MKMRLLAMSLLVPFLAGVGIEKAWSQHEGHGGMDMPAGTTTNCSEASRFPKARAPADINVIIN